MSTARSLAVFSFATIVLVVAGGGFIYKMVEFGRTMSGPELTGFGAVAIGTYLIGMLPIVFLTLWAAFTGRLRDIEAPKFRMLALHDEIERGGELEPTHE